MILVPTWLHFGRLNQQQINKIEFQDASKFRWIFQSIFYCFWVPLGCQLGSSWRPRRAIGCLLAANLAHLGGQDAPGRRQEPSRRRPKSRKNGARKRRRFRDRLGLDFGWIFHGFGLGFGWISDGFSEWFHGFGMSFGMMLNRKTIGKATEKARRKARRKTTQQGET